MKNLIISFLALISVTVVCGQDYGVPGFDTIAGNPVEYRKLLDRFIKAETRLTEAESITVYYGYGYQDYYTGDLIEGEADMQKSVVDQDFEAAYTFGSQVLQRSPLNLSALYWTLFAAIETKKPWEVRNSLQARYNTVAWVISQSGNGRSVDTAFKVLHIADMYAYCMMELGITEIGEAYMLDRRYNMFEVGPSAKYRSKEIYFDGLLPNRYLDKIYFGE